MLYVSPFFLGSETNFDKSLTHGLLELEFFWILITTFVFTHTFLSHMRLHCSNISDMYPRVCVCAHVVCLLKHQSNSQLFNQKSQPTDWPRLNCTVCTVMAWGAPGQGWEVKLRSDCVCVCVSTCACLCLVWKVGERWREGFLLCRVHAQLNSHIPHKAGRLRSPLNLFFFFVKTSRFAVCLCVIVWVMAAVTFVFYSSQIPQKLKGLTFLMWLWNQDLWFYLFIE